MAARRKREEKPAQSNRGRPGARGVFVIFDRQKGGEQQRRAQAADRALARDDDDRAA